MKFKVKGFIALINTSLWRGTTMFSIYNPMIEGDESLMYIINYSLLDKRTFTRCNDKGRLRLGELSDIYLVKELLFDQSTTS